MERELVASRQHLGEVEPHAVVAGDAHPAQVRSVDGTGPAEHRDVGDRGPLVGVDQLDHRVVLGAAADAREPGLRRGSGTVERREALAAEPRHQQAGRVVAGRGHRHRVGDPLDLVDLVAAHLHRPGHLPRPDVGLAVDGLQPARDVRRSRVRQPGRAAGGGSRQRRLGGRLGAVVGVRRLHQEECTDRQGDQHGTDQHGRVEAGAPVVAVRRPCSLMTSSSGSGRGAEHGDHHDREHLDHQQPDPQPRARAVDGVRVLLGADLPGAGRPVLGAGLAEPGRRVEHRRDVAVGGRRQHDVLDALVGQRVHRLRVGPDTRAATAAAEDSSSAESAATSSSPRVMPSSRSTE